MYIVVREAVDMKLAEVKGVKRLNDTASVVRLRKAFEVGKKDLNASKKEVAEAHRLIAQSTLRF